MTIKPVADLYLITYEDGRPYKYTHEAGEAIDAIGAGFKVEEFVSLENHRAAMLQAGNSQLIGFDLASAPGCSVEVRYFAPPGYAMVPKEPTNEMLNAWLSEIANWRGHIAGYKAMLAAAPQQEVRRG